MRLPVRARCVLFALLALATAGPVRAAPPAKEPSGRVREVRLSVRVEGDGRDARIELPLLRSDERQELLEEKLSPRGFSVEEVERDGNRLAILTHPKLEGRKRITYSFRVRVRASMAPVPALPIRDPALAPEEDRIWLRPTRHLQSSSPLIRETIGRFAAPRLAAGETDAVRLAWDLVSSRYQRKPDGSRNVLKATRVGHASRVGLDRLLATYLRVSGVPARPVGGIDLAAERGRRSTSWVEARTDDGRWVPLSVDTQRYGELPDSWVRLWHGDRPLVVREGVAGVTFKVKVARVTEAGVR